MRIHAVFLAATLSVAPFIVFAQDTTLVGHRIRVRLPDVRQYELGPRDLELRGTLTGVERDTIRVQLPGVATPVAVSRREVQSVAVSRGVPSRLESAGRRAFYYGVTGVLLGWLYLQSPNRDRGNTWEDAIGTGASLGLATGLVVGFATPYERWRRVSVP